MPCESNDTLVGAIPIKIHFFFYHAEKTNLADCDYTTRKNDFFVRIASASKKGMIIDKVLLICKSLNISDHRSIKVWIFFFFHSDAL